MMFKRFCVAAIALTALVVIGARSSVFTQGNVDEFFIVSSVNPAKQQVVVKRPTEVTQVMFVNAATRYLDRSSKPIALGDLHAGDTVYVREQRDAKGSVATEIRKGPMTLAELRKRYLRPRN